MNCPNCKAENEGQGTFCRHCGAELPAAPDAPSAVTEVLLPTPAVAPPPPVPAAPPPMPQAAPPPPPVYAAPPPVAAAPPHKSNTGLIIAIIAIPVLLLILTAIGVGAYFISKRPVVKPELVQTVEQPASTTASGEEQPGVQPTPSEPEKPAVAPVPSTDPVAEATVVLEKYLAADLGHDGEEMKKYLGGQALARFNVEAQGQEDLTVHSKKVSGHTVQDDNTIDFEVTVEWSPSDSTEIKTDTEQYVLKRTDVGWRIFSTPAYPEGD